TLFFLFRILLLLFATLSAPALFSGLPGTTERERVLRHVIGNAGARGNVRAFANAHRRHQGGVTAHKRSVLDNGDVLVRSVIVAGDGAGSNVHAFADLGIAKVAQVIGLRSFSHTRLFGFNKVAHVRTFTNLTLRSQM